MLSSALATVLAQPWSSRFRKQKAEPGCGKEGEELRQGVEDWARFLKPRRPFIGEAPESPGSSTTTPMSHPLPGSQEQHGKDADAFPTPHSRDGAPIGIGIALPPTPPESPHVTSTRSLDYRCYRRQSQADPPGFLRPRFREPSSLLSSKPTTSSLLLSLRRLSSSRASLYTHTSLSNTPPPSPGCSNLPDTGSITQERPKPSNELSRSVSIREGQLLPSTGRTCHREQTDWLDLLNAQSLKHRNSLSLSDWRKCCQQDDDHVTSSNITTSTGNTMTGTNLNLLSFSSTAANTNLLSLNNNVTASSNTTTKTSHNIHSPNIITSSTNATTFDPHHNFSSHSTYNCNYNVHKTTQNNSNTLSLKKNLNNHDTMNSPNTPDKFNNLKSPNTPYALLSTYTSICTYNPLSPNTPDTLKSTNTLFSPKTHVSTNSPLSPKIPINYTTPKGPNTPSTPVSLNTAISTETSISSIPFNNLNSQNTLNSYKNVSDGGAGSVHSLGVSTVNFPNTRMRHVSTPHYTSSTLTEAEVPRLLSRTKSVVDRAKVNYAITPSNAQLEGVATCCTGEGKGGPGALHWPMLPTRHQSLERAPRTMDEPPVFSSLRTAGACGRQGLGFSPSPCLSSPDPDQTLTPWRCHLTQGHKPASWVTFNNARDPLFVKSQSRAPQKNTSTFLISAHPPYSRDFEFPPSTLSPRDMSQSSDRSDAVPMDTTDITSPYYCELGERASAHLAGQPQSNTPACCKTSQDMFPFMPKTNLQPSDSGVGVVTGLGTDNMHHLCALQHLECKPQMSPHQSLVSTDHFNQLLTNSIDSSTNQGSERVGAGLMKYTHSLPSSKTCIPAARYSTTYETKPRGIVGNKERGYVIEDHGPALLMKHRSDNRSSLMFRSAESNLSPHAPVMATQPMAPMCDGTDKAIGEGNKGSPKVDQIPSCIKKTKQFHEKSPLTRKNSISMQDLVLNKSSQVSEGDRAWEPGSWHSTGVLRPLNCENKTWNRKLRSQQESQVMRLPMDSNQPGPVQDGCWHSLKNCKKNHSYQRCATVLGRPSSHEASLDRLDFNPEDIENENVFYSTDTETTYSRRRRKKSMSFCEPEDARRAISAYSNSTRGPKSIQQEPLYSPSPSPSPSPSSCKTFPLHRGRSFSVSSVHSSRPSGCGRISKGPKLGSSLDLRTVDVDVASWGHADLGGGGVQHRTTHSFSFSLDQDAVLERHCVPCQSEMPASPLPSPPESPRPTRRISSSSPTSRTSQDTTSPRSRLPSQGYRSSLSAFDESDSDTTTDDEYYLSPDGGERETEL